MIEASVPHQVYPLTLPFRLLLIVPGILFVLAPFYIPVSEGTVFKDWRVYVFFVVIGGILIYYALTTLLITSAEGIRSYFFYPFHFSFLWNELENIYLEDSGIVYLFWNTDEKKWLHKRLGGRLQLSLFVDDWKNSELIHQICTQPSHLAVNEKILLQPKHALWQHSETMMFYYVICIFTCVPMVFIANMYVLEPIRVTLVAAFLGFMGGTFGGMMALLSYNGALKKRRNQKNLGEIRKLGRWNYVLPFSGWIINFFLGLIVQGLFIGWQSQFTRTQADLNLIALFATTFIQPMFLPYLSYNRPN